MRKFWLIIAMLILVVMVFAMTSGTAAGQGKPLCAITGTCGEEKSAGGGPPTTPPPPPGPPPPPTPP